MQGKGRIPTALQTHPAPHQHPGTHPGAWEATLGARVPRGPRSAVLQWSPPPSSATAAPLRGCPPSPPAPPPATPRHSSTHTNSQGHPSNTPADRGAGGRVSGVVRARGGRQSAPEVLLAGICEAHVCARKTLKKCRAARSGGFTDWVHRVPSLRAPQTWAAGILSGFRAHKTSPAAKK